MSMSWNILYGAVVRLLEEGKEGAILESNNPSFLRFQEGVMGRDVATRLDVGCVADLCVDLILAGDVIPRFGQTEQLIDGYALELGGSATIFASQFAKLGGRVGLIGTLGRDPFGDFMATTLQTTGVDLTRIQRRTTITTGLSVTLAKPDGDRSILTYLGTINATQPNDLTDDVLSACRHWHIASYFLLNELRDFWREWLPRCRDAGVTTSLDTNWDPENRWTGVRELLPDVDVFFPNEAEAQAIAGESDVFAAGRRLAGFGPLVVIKRGGEGVIAFQGATETAFLPEDAPPTIVDTVGAGDNFDAGFLRAWLSGGDMKRCLTLGHRCGRSSLEVAGGIRGQYLGGDENV
jgi:sugar/nucleoside kinase (ribokinase family)